MLSGHQKRRPNIGVQDQLSLNAGQKYCRMHSAILWTFINLPFAIKTFVLSIFEWPLKTGFTELLKYYCTDLSELMLLRYTKPSGR